MIPFITLLTVAVLVFSLAAAVLAGLKRMEAARCFEATAWFTALGLFAANCKLAESLPFGNMRQVMCFFPLVLGPMSLYMRRWRGTDLTACFSGVGVVAMVGALCMPMQATWRQMPALQSAWFAPHVTSYVIAYGLLAVSAVLVVMSFRTKAEERLQAADEVVRLAFPFLTFGLWSGALWADVAWARYWAWDIKEVWALITWIVYLIYFHVCKQGTAFWLRRTLLLLGVVAVLITFFVVNLLPNIVSVHSYAR